MAVTLSITLVTLAVTNQLKNNGSTIVAVYSGLGLLAADIGAVLIPLLVAGTLATPVGAALVATMLLVNFLYAWAVPHVIPEKAQSDTTLSASPLQDASIFAATIVDKDEFGDGNPVFEFLSEPQPNTQGGQRPTSQ